MAWKNDVHGILFKPSEAKLYTSSHTWGMKLSQVGVSSHPDFVGITTFSFQLEYAIKQLSRKPASMHFICNAKFEGKARALKKAVPDANIFVSSDIHQKLILIPEETVYLGSLNFVNQYSTKNFESTIGIRSHIAYNWALDNLWVPVLNSSREVTA